MDLPEEFLSRIQSLLGKEANDFINTYQNKKTYGLRVNPLKCSTKALPFTLRPVPWAKEGFYALPEEHPGKHPLHEGGAYYIQEPSAMAVVSLLSPEPGDRVCDLCAAPGGKSTQIAGRLLGKGLLVSNEIFPARAKILSQNLERFGVGNLVVCNEPPEQLAGHFPLFFDKILIDAPCSGEGMFRKDETAVREWSPEQVSVCKERQQMILSHADRMLAPGGVMVYSTCTFAPEEDEAMIAWFLGQYPDYDLEDWRGFLPENCGLEGGRTDFLPAALSKKEDMEKTLRLWPHKLQGEGHFAARLRKKGEYASPGNSLSKETYSRQKKDKKGRKGPDIDGYLAFAEQFLRISSGNTAYSITTFLSSNTRYEYFGDELYLIPQQMNSLPGLKTVRPGLHLGTRKTRRFEPAHALAMALHPEDVSQYKECTPEEALCFSRGETLSCPDTLKSWTLVCYQGISLGWGKAQNGILKNHYPKGLRTF